MPGESPSGDMNQTIAIGQPQDSPIELLPPELLAEIFEQYTQGPSSPVLLTHVSRLWRRTAITTPRLWRSISAKLPSPTLDTTSTKVHAWLTRSGAFPLNISLVVTDWSNEVVHAVFDGLRKHSSHWDRLSLTAGSYDIARRIFEHFTSSPHHDMLSRIDLKVTHFPPEGTNDFDLFQGLDEDEDPREDITKIFFAIQAIARNAPRFSELNILSSVLPYASWGTTVSAALLHLRTLRIFELGGWHAVQIDAPSVLRVLAMCPALEIFSFRGWNVFDPHSVHSEVVYLPHLRELHLAQTFHQRVILSHLSAPSLEVLRLSWLNRPDQLTDDSYEPDSSDEDEALIEYSQSPYTDVLTGIGLRSLVRRCAPPIRVLDMDFADARSPKDFLWVFSHMPTLESFRIVGSDMSDKVLDALASSRKDGTWLCPRLTTLEFSRCDMITGPGVVALAKGRNPPVDDEEEGSVEMRPRPARLTQLIVEACAAVDCESVAVKQHLLNEVDFEVEVMPSSLIYFEEEISMPH